MVRDIGWNVVPVSRVIFEESDVYRVFIWKKVVPVDHAKNEPSRCVGLCTLYGPVCPDQALVGESNTDPKCWHGNRCKHPSGSPNL